jgi:hypothetical protein
LTRPFGDWASFAGAAFGAEADFASAAFDADFRRVIFKNSVDFTGVPKERWISNLDELLRGIGEEGRVALKKWHEESRTREGSAPDRFLRISFANARFDDVAIFSGRTFDRPADFINARRCCPWPVVTNMAEFATVSGIARW